MAIAAASVFEVRTGGSDTNGGGFVTGASGTDYSQQNSANVNGGTDGSSVLAAIVGTTTVTCADANFSTAIVGNLVFFSGGTGSITGQWRQVTARASSTSITVDTAFGTSSGMTMNVGGALLSLGQVAAIMISGNIAYFRNVGADGSSIFSITSASTNVSGGTSNTGSVVIYQGYTSNRTLGNTDARPVWQINVSTATIINTGGTNLIQNMILDGNSQTAAKANASGVFYNCLFKSFNTVSTGAAIYHNCAATTNSVSVFSGPCYNCEAYANTATPFSLGYAVNCIASDNTGATTDGFIAGGAAITYFNCIAIRNGRDGFRDTLGNPILLLNCHAESNTVNGFNLPAGAKGMINCSYFNNGTNVASTLSFFQTGTQTPSASPFINSASNNFALNNVSNQGALLRGVGSPAIFPRGLTSNSRDIGAAQSTVDLPDFDENYLGGLS